MNEIETPHKSLKTSFIKTIKLILMYSSFYFMHKFILIISLILFSFSCSDSPSPNEKCRFGEPTAIFKKDNSALLSTTFKKEGRIGIETVEFKKGFLLELTQSGCQEIIQDFAFTLPMVNNQADGQFWIQQGEQLMRFMGNTDPSLMQFSEWANMIAQSGSEMKLGQAKEIQTGYFVTIDKISGNQETIVKVTLEGR